MQFTKNQQQRWIKKHKILIEACQKQNMKYIYDSWIIKGEFWYVFILGIEKRHFYYLNLNSTGVHHYYNLSFLSLW